MAIQSEKGFTRENACRRDAIIRERNTVTPDDLTGRELGRP
jgi:hypothetical protein